MLCRRLAAQWVFLHILASLALCAQAGAAAAPPQGQQAITLAYDFESPQMSAAGDHTRLAMPGCGRTRRVGEPALPFRLARVLLPLGCTVTGVEARLTGPARSLDVARPVEFGRVAVPFGADAARVAAARAADRPRPEVYNSNNPYPQQRAELLSVQRMCGYDIALIRIFPVQYTPKARKLLFSPCIELTVHIAPQGGKAAANTTLRRSKADAARVAALVDNPEALPEQPAEPSAPAPTGGPQPAEGPYDYLLVTGSSLLSSFQPLLNHRTAQGLRVKAEAIENIVNSYAGVDTAEKLRNYIIYAYTNWGIQYVLLGGDVGVIPARGVYGKVSGAAALGDYVDNSIPCDLYYACLDGPWNFDGDALWGEPNDGAGGGDVDLVPEVYLGRAAVDTVALTQQFVAKTIAYETTPHPHPDTALFLAESLGGGAEGGDGLDPLLPHFSNYTVNWLDDRVAYWSATQCLQALNNSPHLVAHCGHTNWNYALRLSNSNLSSLTNTGLFLVNSIGCYPGAFDYSDCFAEVLHLLNGVGAFAVVMNSRYGWYNPYAEWMFSGEFQKTFFNNLLTKGYNRIGVAHQRSKTDMLGSVEHVEGPDGMVYRWCYFELTLFGDPYTAVTTATSPQNLTVKSFDATPTVNNYFTGLNVTVNPAPNGVTEFTRSYPRGSNVALTAPPTYGTVPFRRWKLDDVDQPVGQTTLTVAMTANRTAVAVYVGPGIIVQPTSGLKTTEAGGTAQFTVALATQPTANVTIGLSSSDPSEGTVSPTSLTFTP
ncbi:MAG TPA: C25 family cysteine peptidase, partial [Planctomycetota bacterium]|nr:C25 family cysteine peptidase [Planctomycetota bacterium]HRR79410.1 C25 family cysteine peptidase [Planctomycetota bacterium]